MGSIPEAIGKSRQNGLLFIVYIEGDNEATQKMNSVWSDPKVAGTLSKDKCVAIKLDHKSEDCNQFSKLYPIVCIPVTYFIGENGLPLEVIGGDLPVDDFVSRANKALETHQKSRPINNSTITPTSTNSVLQSSPEVSSSNQHFEHQEQPTRQETSSEVPAVPGPSQEPTNSSNQEKSLNERVQRAKDLIERRRQEKEEQENQEAKKKESDRRNLGQELAKAKREREERQAQDIVNQIKEDRAKERAHREAVRQQIARDRAEREARRQNELQERQRLTQAAATASGPSPVSSGGSDSTSARLQFRLPDGSSVTNTFPADTPLQTVQQFIINHLGPSTSSVTLYTTYPRRELTEGDLVKTLAELGLVPSSTLVVAMKSCTAITPSGSSSFSELLIWILSPLFTLITLLKAFFLGSPDHSRGAYNPTSSGRQNTTQQSQQSSFDNGSTVRRRGPGGGATVREQGGVHRLYNRDDDDDESNTWNGNSTQQM